MKRRFTTIAALLFIAGFVFAQDFIDRGYLTLTGPRNETAGFVSYTLTTNNEKGGESRTVFVEGSYDSLLELYYYDSKDYCLMRDNYDKYTNRRPDEYTSAFCCIHNWFMDVASKSETESSLQTIGTLCDQMKEQLQHSYLNYIQAPCVEEDRKALETRQNFSGSSGLMVEYIPYVDSRGGYFLFTVFQKETGVETKFMVTDSTEVYYCEFDEKPIEFNNLDEKVLALCSEVSINNTLCFCVENIDSLKSIKNCAFIIVDTGK